MFQHFLNKTPRTALVIAAAVFLLSSLSSCVRYKALSYTQKSRVLKKKLPNLSLHIDTASFCQAIGQYQTEQGFLIYNPKIPSANIVKLNKYEYTLVSKQFFSNATVTPSFYGTQTRSQVYFQNNIHYWPISSSTKQILIHYNYLPVLHVKKTATIPPGFGETKFFNNFEELQTALPDLARARLNFKMFNLDKAHKNQLDSLKIEKTRKYYVTTFDELQRMPLFSELSFRVQQSAHSSFDNRTTFQFEFLQNEMPKICDIQGEKKGRIELRIVDSKLSKGWGWFALSTLTLYTINFIGFPVGQQSMHYTLEATIYNQQNKPVYTKKINATGTAMSAMFWGYSMLGIHNQDCFDCPGAKVSAAKVIYKAMDTLKLNLEKDYNKIVAAFME